MTPDDRDAFLAFAVSHQRSGSVFGWSLDEDGALATVFVPSDRPAAELPAELAGIEIVVVRIPTPEEQSSV